MVLLNTSGADLTIEVMNSLGANRSLRCLFASWLSAIREQRLYLLAEVRANCFQYIVHYNERLSRLLGYLENESEREWSK